MVQYDLEGLMGQHSTFFAGSPAKRSRTFIRKDVRRGRLFEVISLAMRPLPQEVPQQSKDQDYDTSDTTNYTTDDRCDGNRSRGNDREAR